MEKWVLTFPSGPVEGDSAKQVLLRLSKMQYDPDDRRRVKRALAWRTWVLLQQPLDEELNDEEFVVRLCELGMARLEVYTNGNTEPDFTVGQQP